MTMRLLALAAALAIAGSVNEADAHAHLRNADPAQHAMLRSPPSEIRMGFSEAVIARFSGATLTDSHGKTVPTGPAARDPNDDKRLIVPVKAKLQTGTYTVAWHVVSADTHRMSGSYSFKVAH